MYFDFHFFIANSFLPLRNKIMHIKRSYCVCRLLQVGQNRKCYIWGQTHHKIGMFAHAQTSQRSPGAAALYLGFVLFHDIDHRGRQISSYIWLKISEVQYQWTINIMSATIKATSCRQFPPLNDNMKSTFQRGQDSLCLDYFSYFNLSPMNAGSVLNVFTIIN